MTDLTAREVLEQHLGYEVGEDVVAIVEAFASRSVEEARREAYKQAAALVDEAAESFTKITADIPEPFQPMFAEMAGGIRDLATAILDIPDAPERDGG